MTLSISPILSSTTILVTSVDSSRRSLTPSSIFSLTKSAILVTSVARLTLYGIWVIIICCLPLGKSSMCMLPLIRTIPLPVFMYDLIPDLPAILPPEGKSGPGRISIISSMDIDGSSIREQIASISSRKL